MVRNVLQTARLRTSSAQNVVSQLFITATVRYSKNFQIIKS